MNRLNAISIDCNLDRRTVLKVAAGISVFAVTRPAPGSAAVLENNGEIVALSARAAADYIGAGNSAPSGMLRRCSPDTRLTRI